MKPDRFIILQARLNRMEGRVWPMKRTARWLRRMSTFSNQAMKLMDRQLARCDRWKHRGKEARRAGLPCACLDARLSPISRLSWVLGWQGQDAHMQPPPSAEQIRQNEEFFTALRAECRAAFIAASS